MYENGIRLFDDVTTYSYLTSKPKETNRKSYFDYYNQYGGYQTVEEVISECDGEKGNDEYHFSEIQKYESLRNLQKQGLIDVTNKELVTKLTVMNLRQMQSFFQYKHKESFSHVNSGEVIEYNLIENLDETIDQLEAGEDVGIPLYESPRLNKKINGQKLGNLMYLVLPSGVGKSSIITEKAVLGLLESGEKGLIFANEEGVKRWRTRLLVTVAARILKKPVARDTVNRGRFNAEVKTILKEAAEWLRTHRPEFIKFIQLKKYRIEDVINRIELYRPLGYSHVYFDTFKPDLTQNVERWLAFSNSAQELYDCIKEEANNCATIATVQLKIGKEFRYIDLDCIGKSAEIVEVAAVVLAGRLIFSDEYPGEKHALKPYNWVKDEGFGKWIQQEYTLDPKKKYLILFLPKNREGSEDEQIVFEVNYDFNIWKEVALVVVPNNGRQ
ncbi:replication protein [Paenibacillus lautus]|uniref:replication protein n=1 Tax=Paenibacillus lautus TaxID=1401 RepID=UPI00203C4493|nr:replication protein [Paenibacillus lautus]MCM3257093.1 replication protein [Paenibacillus lautus]